MFSFYSRSVEDKMSIARDLREKVWLLLEQKLC
ncbi:zinc-binding dehydrogenase [Xenorhabdus ishibashii]|uniref:Zinc-binding dehydrogenase n=1 Tax=Xenorhabdus ishibashii TaxID=1034471 RepID=A0A2D0K9J3_9GAMM|nr:zinc-binding dehydrogenase [Xenorhabdus ishibashii]